jgi:hypothetical protein
MTKDEAAELLQLRLRGMFARMYSRRQLRPGHDMWQFMRGERDMTIREMGEVAFALGFDVAIEMIDTAPRDQDPAMTNTTDADGWYLHDVDPRPVDPDIITEHGCGDYHAYRCGPSPFVAETAARLMAAEWGASTLDPAPTSMSFDDYWRFRAEHIVKVAKALEAALKEAGE